MQERTRLGLTRADEAWKEETLFERVIDDTMEEFDRQLYVDSNTCESNGAD